MTGRRNPSAKSDLAGGRQAVLVFLPGAQDVSRFLASGALAPLAERYRLHFAFSSESAPLMGECPLVAAASSRILDIPEHRLEQWRAIYVRSRRVLASRARSLRLPKFAWRMRSGARAWAHAQVQWLRRRWGPRADSVAQSMKRALAGDSMPRAPVSGGVCAPVQELMERLNPLFCLASTSRLDTWLSEVLLAARPARQIVMALQSGPEDLSVGPLRLRPDFIGVRGSQSEEEAWRIQRIAPDACVVLGPPDDDPPLAIGAAESYGERLLAYCRAIVEPRAAEARVLRAAKRRRTVSEIYGADAIVQNYCRKQAPPTIRGFWMHGWIPAYHNVHPAFIAMHKMRARRGRAAYRRELQYDKAFAPQWVARADQADYLKREGYAEARAIGLPFAYLPRIDAPRRVGALLAMPPHGHFTHGPGNRGPGDRAAAEYADYLAAKRGRFGSVAVCLTFDDYYRNEWRWALERRGIDIVVGADPGDPHTLLRLKELLAGFEYVTTNGFGSHIAYAAATGAKVSIAGPFAPTPMDIIKTSHAVKLFPELAEIAYEICAAPALRAHFPFLFCEPEDAEAREEWGRAEIGAQNVVAPEEFWTLLRCAAAEPQSESV